MNKNVTMRDIAGELGISVVTVSKALSGKEGVGPELKARIISKAEEMGYRKNMQASELRGRSSRNIGLLINSGAQNMQTLVYEISRYLLDCGYYSVIEVIEPDRTKSQILENNKVDGVLVLGAEKPAFVNTILNTGIPCVLVDFFYDASHVDAIIGDNLYGGYALTKHLISFGHQKIGFVGNPHVDDQTMDRYLGYCKAMNEFGFSTGKELLFLDTDDYGNSLEIEVPQKGPSAYVCSHSKSANKFMGELKKSGLAIPSDVSIAGFDDDIFAMLCEPKLTVFSLDYQEMALVACQSIIRKIEEDEYHFGRKTIGGVLKVRESTAKIRKNLLSELGHFG